MLAVQYTRPTKDYKSLQLFASLYTRLPTNSEIKHFLHGRAAAGAEGADSWAPTQEGDWIQIGDLNHAPGKSHIEECGGYPGWGDDPTEVPFRTRILMVRAAWASTLPEGANVCFDELQCHAESKGMRIPTNHEVRESLRGSPAPGCAGKDVWSPSFNNGKPDWMQIGDLIHEPGKSHLEHFGYPGWGNDSGHPYSPVMLMAWHPSDGLISVDPRPTWDGLSSVAQAMGRRLPDSQELRDFLDGAACPGAKGSDKWSPVVNLPTNGHDWMQIGDLNHEPGKSHVEHFGYPGWGDEGVWHGFLGTLITLGHTRHREDCDSVYI